MKTLLALEPRILFDGAALATGAEVVQDTTTQDQPNPDANADAENSSGQNIATDHDPVWSSDLSPATPSDRREIVFIDTRVEDYQTLIEGIDPAAEVFLLDARRDGIEQIAEALKDRRDIDAIHLIGEGTEAELHVGSAFLTNESISNQYAELFTQIGQSLSADADLLIYGCNFGRGVSGFSAMQTLAELTGADIAASTDRTGHVSEFANWHLEVSTGFIETSIIIGQATQDAWEGVLATYTVTTTTDGGAGSLRQAILNANANAGTDTITFVGSGTYLLTLTGTGENAAATGDLDITESLNIIGNGAGSTIIDASGLGATPDRVFDIRTGITTISGVTIKGGSGTTGAGIETQTGTTLNLIDVELRENVSSSNGGAIFNRATLSLDRVTIANNTASSNGGGIYFSGGGSGTLTNVTISSNSAANAGGLYNFNTTVTILNSTIANNSTGITQVGGGAITQLKNSILDNVGANANTPLTSMGFNIDSDGTAGFGGPVDPMLGALTDNGGPTRTHALLAGSPAIDAGTATGAPAVDQRGVTRDASVDIGAFESISNTPPVINDQVFPVTENSANGTSVGTVVGTDADPQKGYGKLYWVDLDTDEVRRINLDGSGSQQLAVQFDGTGATGPRGVTVDDVNGKIYWTNNTTNSLWRADLDGGNPQQLLTGLNGPLGIAVDPAGGKIYWVDTAATAIWQANLDGSSPAALITGITNSKDLAVDVAGGKLYWTDKGAGTIKRANLNGSTIETIVSGLNDPWGIALDIGAGKVYWSDATLNEIQRADMMVGATAQTVVTGANQPRDLTLDLVQGKIYWTAATTDRIESATLAGSPLPPVTPTGNWPSGLAIGPAVPNLTYAIIGGNTGGAFAINSVSGELTVVNSAALDYETNPSFGLTVQLTDSLGLNDTATITINLGGVNEGPAFSGLDNTPTFTEGGPAVVLDNNATITDPELDAANNYNGATLTLVRNGGANPDDRFAGSGSLSALTESGNLVVGGTTIGTVTTNSGGTLVLTFNSNATTARVNSALQQITYANSSGTPPATVQVDFTIDDGNAGGQGSGGALNDTGSITVTIDPNATPVAAPDSYTIDEDTSLTTEPTWFNEAWLSRQKLTFNNTAQAENLTDFPVLITLNAGNIDYTRVQNAGEDLRFVDPDGTELAYEIESWNESGTSYVWVKVPQIDASSGTDYIWMYYDNAGATDNQNAAGVWSNNFEALSHLHNDFLDSTGNAHNGINNGSLDITGTIGDGQSFDGVDDRIDIPSGAGIDNLFTGGATVSAWINPSGWGEGGFGRILDKGNAVAVTNGWALQVENTGNRLIFELGFSGNAGRWRSSINSISLDTWQLVTVAYDSSSAANDPTIYVNGVALGLTESSTPSGTANSDAGLDLSIGNRSGATDRTFQGILDETRIETAIRSADWIKAQYLSMTDAFVTFTAAEGPAGVLANDTDADGDPLTAIQVSADPANAQSFTFNADGSFSYTPVANFTGVDTFTYKVNDGTVDGNTVVVTINVTPVNDAPLVATNTGTTVSEASSGNTITTAMLNEGDPDDAGTGLTYTVTAVTTNGTLRLSGTALGLNDTFTQDDIDTNRVTYDHNGSETTTDSFSFSLADGGEDGATPATGVFSITITPANDQPVFNGLDNTPTFTEGGAAVVLDGNATIADTELDAFNNYNGATLTLVRNGGANADDVFAGSGTLGTLTDSGSLVVAGTTIGTVTTNSGGTLVLTFNGNATTARVNSTLQQITYANSSGAPPATVQIDFTINDGNAGSQGSGGALNDTGSITVTINANNSAPTFNGLDQTPTFVQGGGAVVLDNNASITDPELDAANNYNGATLTLVRNGGANAEDLFNRSGTLNPLVESGNLVVSGTTIGTVTTNSGGALVLTFNSNATTARVNSTLQQITYANSSGTPPATVQIDFTIDDGNAGSQGSGGALNDTGSITVTINATNIPPVAVADSFTVTQGSTTILNLAGNDLDADDGLDLTSITIISGPTNGTIASINTDGTVTYTHNGSATITDSFTYTINDLAAATSNTVTVSLVVNLLNVPPVALADSFTVNEGSTNTLNLAGNDLDVDDGLDLTSITIVAGPTNGTIASINPDGTVTYRHNGSETLSDSFTYTIRDQSGATSNTVTVSLNVTPINNSPTLRNVPVALNPGTEDSGPPVGAVGTLVSSLVDLDTIPGGHDNVTDPDPGALTGMAVTQVDEANGAWFYSTDNGANWLALSGVNPNAARLLAADGVTRLYFQPNPDYFGTVTSGIRFRAWDQVNGSNGAIGVTTPPGGTSGFSPAQVTAAITINPVGDAPIITSNGGGPTANVTVLEGSTVVTDVNASDADGDLLTYSIIGGADATLFRIDPTTGILTFITAPDFRTPGDVGADNVYDVIVQASDGTSVDTQAIAITVTNVPPTQFTPPPASSPTPTPDPPPRESGEDTTENQVPVNGGSLDPSSPGTVPEGGQGLTTNGPRDSDTGITLGQHDLSAKQVEGERTGTGEMLIDIIGFLQKPFDITALKSEIRSLLHRSGFLQDLDRVRDEVEDVSATEKTYVASSIAVSTGLSIGYVVWLLRSGVLLTALLSSVPAWQFVNPLLVLDSAARKKRQKGRKDVKDDSVEFLFEKSAASTGIGEEKTVDRARHPRARWFQRNRP
ncbi:DUF2341 domain-containing protein [Candidatus Nitrospira allomarina]|uniref:DUF2341 domain-containing protein n=1 Tax=Candidatus Nitrospira allomarina TaxID=3020900 RepID=A0AA96JS38_9BACT|nr:DUF2341 domain-containing protein [Candidatus Nitrospira allomarina]WNM57808.1 DUF2341 domain-containing protein [Candidatus Nitrospira allomarina]